MKSGKDWLALFKQFFKFGIVGISNTLISLGIYYVFIWIRADLYVVGNTVGFIVSVLNAYYWNRKFVFRKTEKGNLKPLIKTFVSYGATFLLNTALLVLWVEYVNLGTIFPPLLNLLITIPLNFLLNKFWAFK